MVPFWERGVKTQLSGRAVESNTTSSIHGPNKQSNNRRMWVRDRSRGRAFRETVQRFDNEQRMTHFRMSRSTFNFALDLTTPKHKLP